MKKFQIVVDSSSDIFEDHFNDEEIGLKLVPLTIHVGDKEFVDDVNLDTKEMLDAMHAYPAKSTSSCPPVGKFEEMFLQAENTICITLSSGVSGTYNAARLAADSANEKGCNVVVIDSLSTNGVLCLGVEKCYELIKQGLSFEEVAKKTEEYIRSLTLFIFLDKYDNLIKNGRMSKFSGIIAGVLKIKPICSPINGDIKLIEKKRTTVAAVKRMIEMIGERVTDLKDRTIVISHCFDEESALAIKDLISECYTVGKIRIMKMRGLACFYALEKGILISF
ncbi:MAG: DegV family protein [bacterium]